VRLAVGVQKSALAEQCTGEQCCLLVGLLTLSGLVQVIGGLLGPVAWCRGARLGCWAGSGRGCDLGCAVGIAELRTGQSPAASGHLSSVNF
jgi:hypothetical protein